MNTEIIAEWFVVSITFAATVMYSYFLGRYVVQVIFRLSRRDRMPIYRKWGVERDLLDPRPLWWFIAWGVIIVIVFGITFPFSAAIINDWKPQPIIGYDAWEIIITITISLLTIGILVETEKITKHMNKVDKLEQLPPHFHKFFSITELLAMYENLQHAPPIFWEEYSKLDKRQISHDMNRRFRENAAPFRRKRIDLHNNVMLWIGIIGLLVAVVLLAIRLFGLR